MKNIFSLDAIRGALAGLGGTGAGVVITMLVRRAIGLPAWNSSPVMTIGILTGVLVYLATLGVFNYWARWAVGAELKEERPSAPTWTRYFNVDTNHKVIGVQYLAAALFFLPFAVALQVLGRLHMAQLGPTVVSAGEYETIIGTHGLTMFFIVVLPAWSGFMNYFVPLMIGARDMAFPRLNAFSFWFVPPAGLLVAFSLAAGSFDTGWTAYPPLSSSFQPLGMDMIFLGIYLSGFSSILTAINVLTTAFKLRARAMTPFKMPVFVWSSLATTGLTLVFTQFVAMAFLMILLERVMHMNFFRPEAGGHPLLYQYLFWFYSHPAVYVFVLPGLGIISEIIPVFARKPLFGYRAVAVSSPGIALGGMFVWAHHMFAAGMASILRIPFMITTLLVAVPTGVKVFAWTTTLWMGKLRMTTAFLFVLSSVIVFLIGGITGVPLGIVPVDLYVHDTYFVVGHFHGTVFGGFLLPVMAAVYYWYPKVTGRLLSERLGKVQWLLMTLGAGLLIIPMLGLGLLGMRRRSAVYDVPSEPVQYLHFITMIAAFLLFAGVIIVIYNIVHSFGKGRPAGNNPWQGRTLEWHTSSPPPDDNFPEIPEVIDQPYGYGIPGAVHAVVGGKKLPGENQMEREQPGKSPMFLGIALFLLSEAFLFGSLFWTYYYLRALTPGWPPEDVRPALPLAVLNTLILLISSGTMLWAERSIRDGSRKGLAFGLAGTFILGTAFLGITVSEWMREPFRPWTNAYGSIFYTLTGFHALHVFAGVWLMLFLFIRTIRRPFTSGRSTGVAVGSWYWHFVDFVWLIVFTTLFIVR
ncbi:MAG: cbb3-type cytochrome c oxidase subunit I [Chloroflexi bacterium]|nr:cbb3-type cytochrome c oxidase subunit I [Chloroflexota bacterium]